MGMLNESYVCWNCEETTLQMDRNYLESETPDCSECGKKMEFFDAEEIGAPNTPEFD